MLAKARKKEQYQVQEDGIELSVPCVEEGSPGKRGSNKLERVYLQPILAT